MEENKIPTAREFMLNYRWKHENETVDDYYNEITIEFTKMHVKAKEEAIYQKLDLHMGRERVAEIFKEVIQKPYPIENIK
jgi:hypothetical protein